MQPILLDWQVIRIYAFGFMALLGFVVSSFYLWKESRELGWEEEKVMDKFVVSVLAGLLMARVGYVLTHQEAFSSWGQFFNLVKYPGLSFWGVWLGVAVSLWLMTRRESRQRGKYYDIFAIAGAIWAVFLSLGCLLNYCVVGRALPPFLVSVWPEFLANEYPVGWYQVITSGLILLILLKLYSRFKTFRWYKSKRDGFVFGSFVLLSVVQKSVLEYFLAEKIYWWGVSSNWVLGTGVAVLTIIFLLYLSGVLPTREVVKEKFKRN